MTIEKNTAAPAEFNGALASPPAFHRQWMLAGNTLVTCTPRP